MPADERSVLPTVRGVPWWGAVLIAVGVTTVGALIDADAPSPLGRAFKVCYLLGCLLAALLVRQRALFTAAAQPPLVAFVVGVVTLYTVNSSSAQGMRAVVLKVVLPIATSFPWILLAFLMTLGVVLARWFTARPSGQALFGKKARTQSSAARTRNAKTGDAKTGEAKTGGGKNAERKKTAAAAPRTGARSGSGRQAATRSATAAATDGTRSATRPARAQSRTKAADSAAERPARPRPTRQAGADQPRTRQAPTGQSTTHQSAAGQSTNRQNTGGQNTSRQASDPVRRPARPRTQTPHDQPVQSARPTAPAARQAQPRPAGPPASTAAAAPRRRATPQTIPARDTGARPRRTAGQVRDKGAIEDLTAGADER